MFVSFPRKNQLRKRCKRLAKKLRIVKYGLYRIKPKHIEDCQWVADTIYHPFSLGGMFKSTSLNWKHFKALFHGYLQAAGLLFEGHQAGAKECKKFWVSSLKFQVWQVLCALGIRTPDSLFQKLKSGQSHLPGGGDLGQSSGFQRAKLALEELLFRVTVGWHLYEHHLGTQRLQVSVQARNHFPAANA